MALSVVNAFLPALRKARGRIVQVSTWTAHLPLPFNGPSGASKAAMEVFATVYREELKRFGIAVVVAVAGNMKTGGPAKTAAALTRTSERMTPEEQELYGQAFNAFGARLNGMQSSGLASIDAAKRVIELAEQNPPQRSLPLARMLTKSFALSANDPTTNRMRFVFKSSAWNKPETIQVKESAMTELIATNDSRAMRNKNNVLALYDLMINQKRSEEATAKFVRPSYIQHNPLIPDGSVALGRFFAKITSERPRARVVVHQIIAVGDYVWAHLNFLNLFNDDPNDTGIAGVDIYRMDAEGKAVEHWDTLQLVGTPQNSAPIIAPNIPRANANRMF